MYYRILKYVGELIVFWQQNLLLDDSKDFSTMRDDIGKEKLRLLAVEKKKRYSTVCIFFYVLKRASDFATFHRFSYLIVLSEA